MTAAVEEASAERFAVRVTAETHFAWLRTRFALERTMMAGQRTAVSLIGFGFAIVQFFERLEQMPGATPASHPEAAYYLGMSLILGGILVQLVATWQYRRALRYLWRGSYAAIAGVSETGMRSPLIAIALVLVCVGLFAFFAVLFRLV